MSDWMQTLTELVRSEAVDPEREDCCVLTARLMARHAGTETLHHPGTKWWQDANVWDIDDSFSSVRAAAQVAQVARGGQTTYATLQFDDGLTWTRLASHLKRGRMYLCQGWRKPDEKGRLKGHTWMMRIRQNTLKESDLFIESGRKLGLRVNRKSWRPGGEVGHPVFLPDLLLQYQTGIGIAELW